MKLIIDTDAFCKLGKAGLLHDAVRLFSVDLSECARLPALHHMLRRNTLRRRYGADTCDSLIPFAEAMEVLPRPSDAWIDKLVPISAIDPGEAQILAVAAEFCIPLLSGDKRALVAVKAVEGLPDRLQGLVASLEEVLLAVCRLRGAEEVRSRVAALSALDRTIKICFSPGNPDPIEALISYSVDLAREVEPLILWGPPLSRT